MLSQKVVTNVSKGSMIRAMFEEGAKLKKIHGADKVYDFSIGNPDVEPPKEVIEAFKKYIQEPDIHKYMSNAGFDDVRARIAGKIQEETGISIGHNNIVMTCGAAGGLNVVFKTILNPDEEVIVFAPFFVEYLTYIDNFGGKPVVVQSDTNNFEPKAEELKKFITPKTKAIIINSPNNPTGVIYKEETLKEIAKVLEEKEQEYNTTIFVLSDEPYNKLVYDVVKLPSVLKIFKNAIIINSYSKSLALPGERIGYIAANPAIQDIEMLMNGLIYCNRVLGFVNAPSLIQKVVASSVDAVVDPDIYKQRRDLLYNHLTKLGFSCVKPEGAFYLFPKSPIPDDVEFKNIALKYNILLVPGSGFGGPGYFRLAYCVSLKTIENSLPAWEALAKEMKLI
ncbi:MAG: pyridoxal phosphate-dependent aminotransferase [Clostridia bacterium]|nr:pyridoxal phosphate-dependent aminotransferase [Clostridia bacterium]